jgi:molecular chaperone GrpE
MARTNGKSEVEPLDTEHELSASDGNEIRPESQSRAEQPVDGGEIGRLTAERDALIDRLARLQAEFDNARKRAAKEQQDYREYAVADAVKGLLPILDSFERALQSQHDDTAEFRNGVELIYKQLQDSLAKLGLRAIPATGEPFDPHLHQAIQMVDTTDAEDHQVLEELQRGYKLKDRLLRPSMVKVARNPKH